MAAAAGTRFNHYAILAPLGAGGMGEVYAARDTRLAREVAIKVLPADFAKDADRLKRFEQEAHPTSALNHPNILNVHDIGTHQGAPFIIAELLEGEELRAHSMTAPYQYVRRLSMPSRSRQDSPRRTRKVLCIGISNRKISL